MILGKLLTMLGASYSYGTGSSSSGYGSSSYSELCMINGQYVSCEDAEAILDAGFAIAGGMLVFLFIVFVGVYVLVSILMMQMFKKFGVESWKAWVPFVNSWTFLELGDQRGWWQFVPIAGSIFSLIAAYNIGLKFGKSGGFLALYIFLPLIWFIIMALKSTTLVGSPTNENNLGGVAPSQVVPVQPVQPVSPTPVVPPVAPTTPVEATPAAPVAEVAAAPAAEAPAAAPNDTPPQQQ